MNNNSPFPFPFRPWSFTPQNHPMQSPQQMQVRPIHVSQDAPLYIASKIRKYSQTGIYEFSLPRKKIHFQTLSNLLTFFRAKKLENKGHIKQTLVILNSVQDGNGTHDEKQQISKCMRNLLSSTHSSVLYDAIDAMKNQEIKIKLKDIIQDITRTQPIDHRPILPPKHIPVISNINSNNNKNTDNNAKLSGICVRCNLPGHYTQNCPTNNNENIQCKPQWHPQYMNMSINGNLIKISENGGIIKRDSNYKCNQNENDLIIFYFNHCDKKFVNECKLKNQHHALPLFVKFFIGFPKNKINNQLLLAYNVKFDYLLNEKEEKRDDRVYGEIVKLPNCTQNRNGWIYCKDNNLMYCFNDDANTHYNIGNIVLFDKFILNGGPIIAKHWAKNIIFTQKYDEMIWKTLYNAENKCIHDNKHRLFIKDCGIDLREDLHTEFKQFYHLNNRCNVIKICETMLKYLNAFINSDGGSIYFGINDKGIIKGIQYIDNETIDNICKYIDNRLREWKPNEKWQNVKRKVKIEYIHVIERKNDDNYCYQIPKLKVIKASINAIKLENNVIFKNHDNQSWTRNMASVSNITNLIR